MNETEHQALRKLSRAPDPDVAAYAVIVLHQRKDIGSCLCGWNELGRSHAMHLLEEFREAGLRVVRG